MLNVTAPCVVAAVAQRQLNADIRHRSLGSPQTTTDMGSLRP